MLLGAGEYFVGIAACALLLFVLELEKLPGMAGIDADNVRRKRAERAAPRFCRSPGSLAAGERVGDVGHVRGEEG